MHCRTRAVFLLLAAVAVVGCTGTDSSGTRNMVPTGPSLFASPYPDIDAQIIALFPTGLETAAGTRWVNVTSKLASGDHVNAEKMFWDLVDWMLKKSERLDDPSGPLTSLGALNKLIGDMYAVVFPGQPRPGATGLNGDATIGLVLPNAPALIVTPTHQAGIALLAGSVAVPTLVVIDQNPTIFGGACSGPLPTGLCQYPQFYRFQEFPHAHLLKPARFAICPVTVGDTREPPFGVDNRLRIAHEAPEVPSPDGTLVDGIEILKLVDVHDFMDCEKSSYVIPPGGIGAARNPMVRGGMFLVNRMFAAAKWVVTPKNAYAIDQGGGGEGLDFSNFNPVDPVARVASFIDFESFGEGGPPSTISDEFENLGATFDFIPTEGESQGFVSLVQNSINSEGVGTNHQIQRPLESGSGSIVMNLSNARIVSFTVRVLNSAPAVQFTAFGPNNTAIPSSQITHSMANTFTRSTCEGGCPVTYREETITVSNTGGVVQINVASGALVFIDDIHITRPFNGD
jgi:hypothetical protein